MFLHHLSLTNFKNYEKSVFDFDKKINCIVGQNGTGKTNLLDAIYYLCLTKSYLNSIDQQNIRHGENFFMLQGDISVKKEPFQLRCTFALDRNKEFLKNGVRYEKLSDHVGQLPVVFITPNDISLIQGGSEERRRFLDGFISQMDHTYLEQLQQYNRVLSQRNALLKNSTDRMPFDKALLQVYDEKLIPPGNYIYRKRKEAIEEFTPVFEQIYQMLSSDREPVSLDYRSELAESSLAALLKHNFEKDRMLKRTTSGIHRDDIDFLMEEHIVRRFGSQGQQKSFLVSVKLAQYRMLRNHKELYPMLLLDDIFDKLDSQRSHNLLEFISGDGFGQIFITDTQRERIEAVYEMDHEDVAILEVANKANQVGETTL